MTERALWVAKSGLDAQQTRMAVISNNLANVNTIGFKKSRPIFEDLLYQNVRQVGANSSQDTELPTGLQLGTGVRIVATEKLHTQGNIVQTENSLDVSIQGRGYLQIQLPNGDINYTRDGSFKLDSNGLMVNSSGIPVEPAITIPEDAISITIGMDGVVTVLEPGNPTPAQVGQIEIASFINPAGLEPIGHNLYRESVASGTPTIGSPGDNELGILNQGSLETSNVNVVEELVNMIETQRAYEMNSKAISTTDEMLSYVTQQL